MTTLSYKIKLIWEKLKSLFKVKKMKYEFPDVEVKKIEDTIKVTQNAQTDGKLNEPKTNSKILSVCENEAVVSADQFRAQEVAKAKKVLGAAAEDNAAYHVMLTNPDMLSSYVNEFFGTEGPYPTELASDRLAAEVAAGEQRFQPQVAPQAPAPSQAPAPQAQGNPTDFWNNFGSASDRDPQNAWKYLTAAQQNPEIFRQKLLVME